MLQLIGPHLHAFLIDVLRLSLWLTILVVIFVPLERLFAAHPQKILRKGIGVDLGYYFLSSLLPALLLSAPVGLLAWAVHRAVPGGLLAATAALPLWARVARRAGGGGDRLLLGPSLEPRDPVPLATSIPSITAPSKSTSWSTPAPIRSTWCSAGSAAWCRSMCWAWAARWARRAAWCPSWSP